MVYKWREEHTPLFLNLLLNRQCLWNVKYATYKNKIKREEALKEIVKELNIPEVTVEDIKNKIKTIRSKYSSELAKVIKSEKNGESIYTPRLFWFQQADSFLRSVCVPRVNSAGKVKTKGNKEAINVDHNEIIDNDNFDSSPAENLEEVNLEIHKGQKILPDYPKICGTKRSYAAIETINRAINKLSKLTEEYQTEEDDEFDIFGKSIALQLRNMPLDRAIICQQQLQNIVIEERIYHYRMQQRDVQLKTESDI